MTAPALTLANPAHFAAGRGADPSAGEPSCGPGGPFVMTEHPAWWPAGQGWRRCLDTPAGRVLVTVARDGRQLPPADRRAGRLADVFSVPAGRAAGLAEVAGAVRALGPVARFRNPSLWDALATAVVRQVVRAGQSKKMYRGFAAAFGDRARFPAAPPVPVFPDARRVLALPDDAYAATGMALKRRPLRNAGAAYLEHGEHWLALPAAALVDALQDVPGIGPWTAQAAVADFTNDWSFYPHGDLAVRTWASRAAPGTAWPATDAEFASVWRAGAGPDLSAITVLVLAWGSRNGDIG